MQNYFNYQPPMYNQQQIPNPYMDRLTQLQTMQQSMQQYGNLNGKVIDSFESIMANDVPMDGTFAIFPKRDMSEICLKYWTGEGKIATIVFKPASEVYTEASSENESRVKLDELSNSLNNIYEKIDILSDKVDEVLKIKNSTRSSGKKEVSANE